jgi:hypothetical protein
VGTISPLEFFPSYAKFPLQIFTKITLFI